MVFLTSWVVKLERSAEVSSIALTWGCGGELACIIFSPSWPINLCEVCKPGRAHSKNEGMKHIPTQYDSHTFSFHTMGMKEAFILL